MEDPGRHRRCAVATSFVGRGGKFFHDFDVFYDFDAHWLRGLFLFEYQKNLLRTKKLGFVPNWLEKIPNFQSIFFWVQ